MRTNNINLERITVKSAERRAKAINKKVAQLEREIVLAKSKGCYSHAQHLEYRLAQLQRGYVTR